MLLDASNRVPAGLRDLTPHQGWAIVIDGPRPGPAVPPPTLSQHRDALLEELGYDAARREALIASGAVG